jgi:hypothetical protein
MALSPNPDQDFSAGYGKERDLENWRAAPAASWNDLNQAVRERVGRLIASAMLRARDRQVRDPKG